MSTLRTSHPNNVLGRVMALFGAGLLVLGCPQFVALGRASLSIGPGTFAVGLLVAWLGVLPVLIMSSIRGLVTVEAGEVRAEARILFLFRVNRYSAAAKRVDCVRFVKIGRHATIEIVLKDDDMCLVQWSSSLFAGRLVKIGQQWATALDVEFRADENEETTDGPLP